MPPWLFLTTLYCTTQKFIIKENVDIRPLIIKLVIVKMKYIFMILLFFIPSVTRHSKKIE